MKTLWRFFSSVKLTIVLAVVICIVAAWGSLLAVKHQSFYRFLDGVILLPWLIEKGAPYLKFTGWIYLLIFLTAVFALNTVVCTMDRVYAVVKTRMPLQAFFPQIVHIGFLIALLGHLAGSVAGYKSSGNMLFKDVPTPVPHEDGLFMRLDDVQTRTDEGGELASVRTRVTLLRDGQAVTTDDIGINSPMLYKGTAFYHIDAGSSPTGIVLDAGGVKTQAGFNGSFKTLDGNEYKLGTVYPDFATDSSGGAFSRSQEFRNPYVEITGRGQKAYLFIGKPGGSVTLGGKKIRLVDYVFSPYVVLNINKDPGIWFIITGSAVLTIGMLLLLFLRGERAELVSRRGGEPPAAVKD